jgi:hypothetical protein
MKWRLILLFCFLASFISSGDVIAQAQWHPPLNYSVKPGGTIRIMRHYMVGNYCGFGSPEINAFQQPKLGTFTTEKKKERIQDNMKLGGDGHSYCDKETGVTYAFYKAGNNPGVDTFDVVAQYGNSTRFTKVTVTISGKSDKQRAETVSKPHQKDNNSKELTKLTSPIKLAELPPANEYFNNLRVGSTFDYEVIDEITKKRSNVKVVITDKNEKEITTSVNGGSLTVLNSLFEQIETPTWLSAKRSCDGIVNPLKLGTKFSFSYSSEFLDKSNKRQFEKQCSREVAYQGSLGISGTSLKIFMVRNKSTYAPSKHTAREDIFNGEFSPDISFWTNISVEGRVNNRLIDKRTYKLRSYSLGEESFSLYSLLCTKDCNIKDANDIQQSVLKANYPSQAACDSDKEARSPVVIANANSIGRYALIFCAKPSLLKN